MPTPSGWEQMSLWRHRDVPDAGAESKQTMDALWRVRVLGGEDLGAAHDAILAGPDFIHEPAVLRHDPAPAFSLGCWIVPGPGVQIFLIDDDLHQTVPAVARVECGSLPGAL